MLSLKAKRNNALIQCKWEKIGPVWIGVCLLFSFFKNSHEYIKYVKVILIKHNHPPELAVPNLLYMPICIHMWELLLFCLLVLELH